jgi:hypothetical protein
MYREVAIISQNITINDASGKAQAKRIKAEAQAGTFQEMQVKQAHAYADLKQNLTLDNQGLIEYMQVQLIKNYPNG